MIMFYYVVHVLRNTQWAFGSTRFSFSLIFDLINIVLLVVCYAGSDTKLMKNSGKAKFKRTQIDPLTQ